MRVDFEKAAKGPKGVYFPVGENVNEKQEKKQMSTQQNEIRKPAADEILLVTSGDLRLSANQVCWPAQRYM